MSVFKEETEFKRVIFNIRMDLAERLEIAKTEAADLGKKLDVEGTINKSLERFLKKAEKKIGEMKLKRQPRKTDSIYIEETEEKIDDEVEEEKENEEE